jgi:hypothetical protein
VAELLPDDKGSGDHKYYCGAVVIVSEAKAAKDNAPGCVETQKE